MSQLVFAGLALTVASPMIVEDRPSATAMVDALRQCLSITEDTRRLACTDVAARRLVEAATMREITVLDRTDIRKTRRSLFGLSADSGAVLADHMPAEQIDQLDTNVTAATSASGDRWVLALAEGGRWQTTEAWMVGPIPRAGMTVSIRRAALGSYVIKTPGARAVRVRRVD